MKSDEILSMEYTHLGSTGMKVSVIGFGNWHNSHSEEDKQKTYDCIQKAYDLGINFFDTS